MIPDTQDGIGVPAALYTTPGRKDAALIVADALPCVPLPNVTVSAALREMPVSHVVFVFAYWAVDPQQNWVLEVTFARLLYGDPAV